MVGFGIQESSMDDQEAEEKVCHQNSPSQSPVADIPPRNQKMTPIAGLVWNFY